MILTGLFFQTTLGHKHICVMCMTKYVRVQVVHLKTTV